METNKVTSNRVIKANFDDIVFRGRNQNYGAYKLRKDYPRHLRAAILYSIGALIVVLSAPIWARLWASESPEVYVPNDREFVLEPTKPIDPKAPEPQPLPKMEVPKLPDLKTLKFIRPEVVRNESAPTIQTIATLEELAGSPISHETKTGSEPDRENILPDLSILSDGNGTSKPVEIAEKEEPEPDPTIYMRLDNNPIPVNMDEFRRKIHYPEVLSESGIQGKVSLRVLLGKDGKIIKHKVLRSSHILFTAEVEKNLYCIQFVPALVNNKPVKAWVNLPISFTQKGK